MPSSTPSGTGQVRSLGRGGVLGVAAGAAEGDDALAGVLAHADDLLRRGSSAACAPPTYSSWRWWVSAKFRPAW